MITSARCIGVVNGIVLGSDSRSGLVVFVRIISAAALRLISRKYAGVDGVVVVCISS